MSFWNRLFFLWSLFEDVNQNLFESTQVYIKKYGKHEWFTHTTKSTVIKHNWYKMHELVPVDKQA